MARIFFASLHGGAFDKVEYSVTGSFAALWPVDLHRALRMQVVLLVHFEAWTEAGPLVNQPMDNNRFVIFLGEVMCRVSGLQHSFFGVRLITHLKSIPVYIYSNYKL